MKAIAYIEVDTEDNEWMIELNIERGVQCLYDDAKVVVKVVEQESE